MLSGNCQTCKKQLDIRNKMRGATSSSHFKLHGGIDVGVCERRGFQRTFLNDIYHVEEQLQSYDPHLYLMWNPKMGNMSSWMDY